MPYLPLVHKPGGVACVVLLHVLHAVDPQRVCFGCILLGRVLDRGLRSMLQASQPPSNLNRANLPQCTVYATHSWGTSNNRQGQRRLRGLTNTIGSAADRGHSCSECEGSRYGPCPAREQVLDKHRRLNRTQVQERKITYHRDLVCSVHPPSHGSARNGGVFKLESNAIALSLDGMHLQDALHSQPLHRPISPGKSCASFDSEPVTQGCQGRDDRSAPPCLLEAPAQEVLTLTR